MTSIYRPSGHESALEEYGLLEYAITLKRNNTSCKEIAERCNDKIGKKVFTSGMIDNFFRKHSELLVGSQSEYEASRAVRIINDLIDKTYDLYGEAEILLKRAKETDNMKDMRESLRLCGDICKTILAVAKELKEPLSQIKISGNEVTFNILNEIINRLPQEHQITFREEIEKAYQEVKE